MFQQNTIMRTRELTGEIRIRKTWFGLFSIKVQVVYKTNVDYSWESKDVKTVWEKATVEDLIKLGFKCA